MKPIQADQGAILPGSEIEVMNAVWTARAAVDRPVTTREILECASDHVKSLKITSVLTVLSRLN